MALIVSLLALAAAHRCASLSRAACSAAGDIDDPPLPLRRSLLARFRERRALAVIDITATVIERVDVAIRTAEESWAVKFMNFIVGTNQLLFDGITRENFRWSWMAGVIDEIRMPTDGASSHPILVDTKTRSKPTIPSEAHKRNGRLQLMCYKYLWDNLNTEKFPAENFFIYFDLNPNFLLSDDVKWYISSLGFDAKTFEDVLKYFKVTCHTVPRSQEQLLLRYELLADHSLLVEYQFPYDARWFKDQIQEALSFWVGAREAKFVIEEESWKCQFCKFVSNCPKMASTSGC
ncbi:exonuclease V, chloroplastic-like isoform X4 [Phragmites australis]|uniref:exonuclease V, chloroplastic-like isoform X4 n=1 Tax=Phragmites australis TaxID=29695 RepID=UPI002D789A63|nr:exonuclease V, chloroplastic-like isoform X4 [Phragmites australis]